VSFSQLFSFSRLPLLFPFVPRCLSNYGGVGGGREGGCHVPDKYELFTLSLVLFFSLNKSRLLR